MKKTLICLSYYKPNISGVTVYAEILAKILKKRGSKVSVLCSRAEGYEGESNEDGIRIIRSWVMFRIGKGLVMPFFVWDSYKEVKRNDLINCHLPQLESFIVAVWAKILRKRLIITHHCEFGFDGTISNRLISILSFPFHMISYMLADRIVSYTKDYASKSIFLRMFSKKIEFILPPVLVEKEDRKKMEELGRKIGLLEGEKVVLYVGRIAWEKGLNFLIEAVEMISKKRKVRLVLVGPYEGILGDKSILSLSKMIERNKKNICLYGAMKHEELVNIYKISDCLVLPSTNNLETFGIVQAEAMLCGCPVVASDLPGVRMPVKMTGLGEISKIGESKDLAKKIEIVLREKYPSNKFEEAKKLFALSVFEDKYVKLFSEE